MLGLIGTLAVVAQMATMAAGIDVKIAMIFGLIACAAWSGHAIKHRDRWLLATNMMVAGFATWGLL